MEKHPNKYIKVRTRSWRGVNVFDWFRWFGLWCLTPLSTISVISWRSVLLVEETGVP
jgi:hypothetical protein